MKAYKITKCVNTVSNKDLFYSPVCMLLQYLSQLSLSVIIHFEKLLKIPKKGSAQYATK